MAAKAASAMTPEIADFDFIKKSRNLYKILIEPLAINKNAKIKIVEHLYTQENFQVSKFRENEQLLTIYYIVEIENMNDFLIMDPCIEKAEWHSINSTENPFQLPIDIIAFEKLQEKYQK